MVGEILDPDEGGVLADWLAWPLRWSHGAVQVVSARLVIQVVEEGDLRGDTVLVDGITGS